MSRIEWDSIPPLESRSCRQFHLRSPMKGVNGSAQACLIYNLQPRPAWRNSKPHLLSVNPAAERTNPKSYMATLLNSTSRRRIPARVSASLQELVCVRASNRETRGTGFFRSRARPVAGATSKAISVP
jgi:hypothetical protein